MSRIGKESNELNGIFADKGNWEEMFGAPLYYLK